MALVPYKHPHQTLFGSSATASQSNNNTQPTSGSFLGQKKEASASGIVQSGLFQPRKSAFGGLSAADTGVSNNSAS